MKTTYILLISLATYSCTDPIDPDYVKEKDWVYMNGYNVTGHDHLFLQMDSNYLKLKGDTIYYLGKPAATVFDINKKNYYMRVKSLQTGQLGEYWNREEQMRVTE